MARITDAEMQALNTIERVRSTQPEHASRNPLDPLDESPRQRRERLARAERITGVDMDKVVHSALGNADRLSVAELKELMIDYAHANPRLLDPDNSTGAYDE